MYIYIYINITFKWGVNLNHIPKFDNLEEKNIYRYIHNDNNDH